MKIALNFTKLLPVLLQADAKSHSNFRICYLLFFMDLIQNAIVDFTPN